MKFILSVLLLYSFSVDAGPCDRWPDYCDRNGSSPKGFKEGKGTVICENLPCKNMGGHVICELEVKLYRFLVEGVPAFDQPRNIINALSRSCFHHKQCSKDFNCSYYPEPDRTPDRKTDRKPKRK